MQVDIAGVAPGRLSKIIGNFFGSISGNPIFDQKVVLEQCH